MQETHSIPGSGRSPGGRKSNLLQYSWKRPYAGKDWRQEEKGETEDEMVGWYHWLNRHEFEWTPGDQWCPPTISSSVALFSSCPQSFQASGSFPVCWLFTSGGQSVEVSDSASVLPMNIQGWFSLGLTGLISLRLCKGLSRVFSRTTVQRHQIFGAQLSLLFNSHVHTWLLENHSLD